jgi:hypothetical protein
MRINKTIGVYDAIVDALPVKSFKGKAERYPEVPDCGSKSNCG